MPRRIEQWMYPIDKTDLDVLRFAHFLALAAITVRFLPKDWPGLKSPWLRPLILCGQHSLEIFCLGVFLAFAGISCWPRFPAAPVMHFIVSISGILIMCAVAWVISWYKHAADKSASRKKRRRQRGYGGRGLMKSNAWAMLGLTLLAGLLTVAPRPRARKIYRPELRRSGLPADNRKRASQGHGSGKERSAARYSGGRQPVVDHQQIGSERLSGPLQAALREKLPAVKVNVS